MFVIPATILSQLRDYIYQELPNRPALIQASEALDNPNESTLAKVIAAPLGSFYLEESNPRKIYIRMENNNDGEDWQLIAVLDSDTNIEELKKKIEECCEIIEARLNTMQEHINDNTRRITLLEHEVFDYPLPEPPIIYNCGLDGQIDLDHTTITELRFKVEGSGTLAIYNPSNIISSPTNIITGIPRIEYNHYGYYELILGVVVSAGKTYSVTILPNSVSNDSEPNTSTTTCTFETIGVPDEPTILDSILESLIVDPNITDSIKFPVLASGELKLEKPFGYQVIPSDIASTELRVEDDGSGGYELVLDLENLQLDMEYTVKILKGAISNNGVKTTYVKDSKFKTMPSEPTVNPDLTKCGMTFTKSDDVKELLFPITTPTSRGNFALNSSLVYSTPELNIVNSSIKNIGLNKYVSVIVENIKDGFLHTITIDAGAIDNNGLPTSNPTTCSFTLDIEEPKIEQCELHGKEDVDHTITEIKFPISGTHTVSIIDSTKIIISDPAILNGTPSIIANELVIPVANLSEEVAYVITIEPDAIENSNGTFSRTNSYQIECEFTTISPEPIINDSTLCGTEDITLDMSEIRFPLVGTGILSVGNHLAISMSPFNGIDGMPYVDATTSELVVPISHLLPNTEVTVSIGVGAVKNNSRENSSIKICKFKTVEEPSIGLPSIHNTRIDHTTLTEVKFPIIANGGVTLLDSTLVTSTTLTITNVSIVGDELSVEIDSTGLNYSGTYDISVAANIIEYNGVKNSIGVTCDFTTFGEIPYVISNIFPNTTMYHKDDISYLEFEVYGLNTQINNVGRIISTPSNIITSGTTITPVSSNLHNLKIPVDYLSDNTTYTIELLPELLINDGSYNNTVFSYSFITSMGIPKLVMPTDVYRDSGTQTIEVSIDQIGCSYTGGIMISGGSASISSANVVEDKLMIEISGLDNSVEYDLNIPIGAVNNGYVENDTAYNYHFIVRGDKPILNIPSLSGVDPSSVSVVRIPVTIPTTPVNFTFDASKIYSKNGVIVGVPTFDAVTSEIEIVVNLDYEKEYEINIYEGVIVCDDVGNDYGEIKFSTITNPTPPIPPSLYDWQYEFVLGNAVSMYDLNSDSSFTHTIPTMVELYIDGKIEMYYLGYVGLPIPTPLKVPVSGIDAFTAPTLDGGYSMWADGLIVFDTGSPSNKLFRIVKLP